MRKGRKSLLKLNRSVWEALVYYYISIINNMVSVLLFGRKWCEIASPVCLYRELMVNLRSFRGLRVGKRSKEAYEAHVRTLQVVPGQA